MREDQVVLTIHTATRKVESSPLKSKNAADLLNAYMDIDDGVLAIPLKTRKTTELFKIRHIESITYRMLDSI